MSCVDQLSRDNLYTTCRNVLQYSVADVMNPSILFLVIRRKRKQRKKVYNHVHFSSPPGGNPAHIHKRAYWSSVSPGYIALGSSCVHGHRWQNANHLHKGDFPSDYETDVLTIWLKAPSASQVASSLPILIGIFHQSLSNWKTVVSQSQ